MQQPSPTALCTIVVPVHNREKLLCETLDSIACQTHRPIKLVVVDNNSTDSSLEVANRWADAHRSDDFEVKVVSEERPGAAMARQRGLDEVDTRWVMFFDSDDLMLSTHLQRALEAAGSHPEADIIGWNTMLLNLKDEKSRMIFDGGDNRIAAHLINGALSTQRYMVRTELLRKVGGWETDIRGWDDYVLGVKLLLAEPKMVKVDGEITVIVRQTAVSVTGMSFTEHQGEWEAALDRCEQLCSGKEYMLKLLRGRRAILAGSYAFERNPISGKLLTRALEGAGSAAERIKLRCAYAIARMGLRGSGLFVKLTTRR